GAGLLALGAGRAAAPRPRAAAARDRAAPPRSDDMNCDAIRSILDLHAEDRLSARWKRRVQAHLERCPACARAAAALRPAPSSVAAPASLKDRLRRAAATAPPDRRGAPNRGSELPALLLSLALAAGLLALLHEATPRAASQRPV